MINTHLKFEARIPNGSKFVALTRNCTKFLSLKANLTLKVKVKVTRFRTHPRLYVINIWFKFEDKILNTSKVIVFTRNHTDDDADDYGTKNNVPPHNILAIFPFCYSS